MTAQFSDFILYKGQEYFLSAIQTETLLNPNDYALFDPKEYGFNQTCGGTACYRGFWCEYEIEDDLLFLEHLNIRNENSVYPELNGVSVSPAKSLNSSGRTRKHKKNLSFPENLGYRTYHNVHMLLPFKGKMLFGAKLLPEYTINMGFPWPFAFEKLFEGEFEEGILLNISDYSASAETIRKSYVQNDPNWKHRTDIQFIEDCFSLDYTRKWQCSLIR